MKKILILMAALLMISCGNNLKEIDLSLLENKSGVFYEKGAEKPFTGKVTAKYPDGKKMLESSWKNGKQDGKADGIIKVYDESGKVILQEEWKDGVKVKE